MQQNATNLRRRETTSRQRQNDWRLPSRLGDNCPALNVMTLFCTRMYFTKWKDIYLNPAYRWQIGLCYCKKVKIMYFVKSSIFGPGSLNVQFKPYNSTPNHNLLLCICAWYSNYTLLIACLLYRSVVSTGVKHRAVAGGGPARATPPRALRHTGPAG